MSSLRSPKTFCAGPMSSKKITILDIAHAAKVSKSTVSRVLNNTTPVEEKKRKAVLKAMKKLDFKPNLFARTLAGGKSMTMGVVTQNIGSPFYDTITRGIIRGLVDTNYSPIFADGQWLPRIEKGAIETLIDRRVDGIIMVGGNLSTPILKEFNEQVPLVSVGRRLEDWPEQGIWIDNVDAAKSATRFLIKSGHHQIVHLQGIKDHQDAIDRLQGYRNALDEAGIEYNSELVVEGDFSSRSGLLAVETMLLRGHPFSAIFSSNDEMAFGARLALYRRGIRVPEDVSLIGFDNQPNSAFMTPPLTTVSQPAIEMGIEAAKLMLSLLSDQSDRPYQRATLEAELLIRESVARV